MDPLRVNIAARQFIKNKFSRPQRPASDSFQAKDVMVAVHRDKNGNIKGVREVIDIMCNGGLAEIAGLIITDVTGVTKFDYIGIGTGDATAQATNDSLESKLKVKAGTGSRVTTNVANDTGQIVATFSSADGLSGQKAITEAVVQNMSTTGKVACRQVFAALNVDWDAGDSVEITEKVVCSGA